MIFSWVAIRSFLLVALLSAAITHWLDSLFIINNFWLWLLAINTLTFLWFAKDKLCAEREGWPRTPEGAFMLMGLAGAFPALLFGMYACKHKHAKPQFWVPMAFYMLVQLGLVYYFWNDITTWINPAAVQQNTPSAQ
jgi:uncharacterized membrane protein YsdA (DUF1294 family)